MKNAGSQRWSTLSPPSEASMRQEHGWAERLRASQASTLGRQCRIENAKWKIVEFPRNLRRKREIAQASAERQGGLARSVRREICMSLAVLYGRKGRDTSLHERHAEESALVRSAAISRTVRN